MILDKQSTRRTKLVEGFLDEQRNLGLHSTPTYSSWLNQVELWFSNVPRDVLSRGVPMPTTVLVRRLRRYIVADAKRATPFRWNCANRARRILAGRPASRKVD